MAGKLSFSIALNFLTENFKKGTSQVKTALKSMQVQILTFAAALGAGGIGLTNFISRLIDVARTTNRVTTALKNVSGSMAQYVENQRFLLDIANKYGLEINALTGNFAKFTAAANVSGMSMDNQKKIFESMSRACTAFGMSADDSNGVMLALSQMMSKGKISSEELRLQMGERLPIALQAMAKAAGVPISKLDKLLKQGKLMSADVLPKFADALNEMIPNVDTDNLETSINRLKNIFTEFVNGTDAQSKYKTLIDGLTEIVKYGADNIKSVISYTIVAILVLITSKLVNGIITAIGKAELAAKSAARNAAKSAGVAFDEIAWKSQKTSASIKMAFSKTLKSLKALFISSIPTAIIAILGTIVAKIVNIYQESKRIKNIYKEYKKEVEKGINTAEVLMLQKQLEIINDKKESQENINNAQKELQRMLGVETKSQRELNRLAGKRIELLKEQARAQLNVQKFTEHEDKNKELASGIGLSYSQTEDLAKLYPGKDTSYRNREYFYRKVGTMYRENGVEGYYDIDAVEEALEEFIKHLQVMADADAQIDKSIKNANKLQSPESNPAPPLVPDDDDDKKKKTDLEKDQDKYEKSLAKLDAELKLGIIKQSAYNKAYDELNKNALIEAMAMKDGAIKSSEYYKQLQNRVNNPKYKKSQEDLEKVKDSYQNSLKELTAKRENSVISEKDYSEELVKLIDDTILTAGAISGIGEEGKLFISTLKLVKGKFDKIEIPQKEARDAFYDYKKTKPEIIEADKSHAEKYRDEIKSKIGSDADSLEKDLKKAELTLEQIKAKYENIAPSFIEELNNAMSEVTSLDEALKIAQVKQDIKELKKQLNKGIYSSVKDIASCADRLISSMESINNVMKDADASGWERFMAIMNGIIQMVDGIMSAVNAIQAITEVSKSLAKAKAKEEEISSKATTKEIANMTAKASVDTATTAIEVTNDAVSASSDTITSEIEAGNSRKKVAANTAESASEVGKSAAKLPFPANVIAIAGAITAVLGIFAAIPKFAKGGIVPGNSMSGDKVLAGLNSGEMVLNMEQQSRLFNMINSGRMSSGIISKELILKVKGRDLKACINNIDKYYNRIR